MQNKERTKNDSNGINIQRTNDSQGLKVGIIKNVSETPYTMMLGEPKEKTNFTEDRLCVHKTGFGPEIFFLLI